MDALKRIGALLSAAVFGVLATLLALSFASIGMEYMWPGRESAKRSVDSSNLRQVGQAAIIFASESSGCLPVATDVHDYARQLASKAGLNAADIWLHTDAPVVWKVQYPVVVHPTNGELDPDFARITPSYAVVSGLRVDMPAETPLAWTRGLSPSGKWAAGSPYHGEGGHIVFLGGNVQFFRDLSEGGGQLRRFDGKGMTADIREAIPPDIMILNNEAGSVGMRPRWMHNGSLMEIGRKVIGMAWLAWLVIVFGVVFVLCWRAFPSLDPKLARIHYVLLIGVPLGLFVLRVAFQG